MQEDLAWSKDKEIARAVFQLVYLHSSVPITFIVGASRNRTETCIRIDKKIEQQRRRRWRWSGNYWVFLRFGNHSKFDKRVHRFKWSGVHLAVVFELLRRRWLPGRRLVNDRTTAIGARTRRAPNQYAGDPIPPRAYLPTT